MTAAKKARGDDRKSVGKRETRSAAAKKWEADDLKSDECRAVHRYANDDD